MMFCARLSLLPGFALAVLVLAPSCKKSQPESTQKVKPVAVPTSDFDKPAGKPADALSQKVEALTEAHTRAVWSHHTGTGSPDPFCSGSSHQLHGLDTRDGRGLRVILAEKNNYSRPLITPDGGRIVFTRKLVTRPQEEDATKIFNMTIMLTDWSGAEPNPLAPGYALAVWQDPASGQQWVYAAQDIPPTPRIAWAANKLVRFRLDDPAQIETVWDQTQISPDNTQFSADGKRASGQTPWPHGGQYVIENGAARFEPTITGCWAGMAPDNSYLSWMLDGSHRVATLSVLAPVKKNWRLKFSEIAGLEKSEIYHPRWSNHPRFITLTGPYLAETMSGEGSIISKGGRTAEVVIAKLNATATGFEGSVTLTENDTTDAYPDVWIAGAAGATLGDFPQGLPPAAAASSWPASDTQLAFIWEALGQPNQIRLADGKHLECHIEPEGAALFGHRRDMQLATGMFKPGALNQAHVDQTLRSVGAWTLEAALLPPALPVGSASVNGSLLTFPGWQFALVDGRLTLNGSAFDHAALSLPAHLAVRQQDGVATLLINGQAVGAAKIERSEAGPAMRFGGGGLAAGLLGVALHASAVSDEVLAASSAFWHERFTELLKQNPPRVRVRGKLAETTGLPTAAGIDPYTRAMVAYVYDVEQVLEGDYDGKQILVCHWAMMDLKPCAGLPRRVGESFDLLVEPLDIDKYHPELKGQRVLDDTSAFDLEPWYDIAPPQLK